ncbi:ATP-binding protein [Halobaculum sp. MBLA0147]|uniref:ATP-binding protein n=1 Tax=Halobaculum sp. MBLA0147 TaxID=3079934 RepID=UPI0035235A75
MSYESSHAHLLDELDRLRVALEHYVTDGRSESHTLDETTDGPVDDLTALSMAVPDDVRDRLGTRRETISEERAATEDVTLRLELLQKRFDLSRNHLDVLLLAVAPEVDDEFGELYATTHEARAVPNPTVQFVESLFGVDEQDSLTAFGLVDTDSPLRRHGLVEVTPTTDKPGGDRYRVVEPSDRVRSYLKGTGGFDRGLADTARVVTAETVVDELRLDASTTERVERLRTTPDSESRVYYFHGSAGSEKRRAVEALVDGELLRGDLDRLLDEGLLERFRREALLQDCPVHLRNVSAATSDPGDATPADVPDPEERPTVEDVLDTLAALERDVYLTGEESWTPTSGRRDTAYTLVEFSDPSFEIRRDIWEGYRDDLAAEVDPTTLASTFELTQGQIDDAVTTARALADDPDEPLSLETIREGCTAQSAEGLEDLAEKIEPDADWDEVVLTRDTEAELREVAARVRHRGTVYEQWGFEERFSRGTGVVALFAGPSGTGKTLSAEVIAADAGMDLYKIDLSSVVSKYIGETEENLERIFDAARDSNAILLFDEADAVFGQRAGVSDATDRYANVEVNYLLQRIESYDGVVLLTTNNESHMDDAFVRRIHQTVQFERPQERERQRIWRVMFPEDTPTEGIDYDLLSQFDMPGGNIRNVAQTAAVLAADDDGVVRMKHVVRATERELNKIGKLLNPPDFGEYRRYLRSTSDSEPPAEEERDDEPVDDAATRESVTRKLGGDPSAGQDESDENGAIPSDGTTSDDRATGDERATGNDRRNGSKADNMGVQTVTETVETDEWAKRYQDDEDGENRPSPENVVMGFFDDLLDGDRRGAHDRFHSEGYADRFSDRDAAMLRDRHRGLSSFERIVDTDRRVVLRFDQRFPDQSVTLEYELRTERGQWRIFDYGRAGKR